VGESRGQRKTLKNIGKQLEMAGYHGKQQRITGNDEGQVSYFVVDNY